MLTVAYDTAYAMVDRPDDLKIGIRTSAITFGRHDVAAIMVCHCAFLALMGAVGGCRGWARVILLAGCRRRAGDGPIPHDPRARPPALLCRFLANNRIGFVVLPASCWITGCADEHVALRLLPGERRQPRPAPEAMARAGGGVGRPPAACRQCRRDDADTRWKFHPDVSADFAPAYHAALAALDLDGDWRASRHEEWFID